MKTKEFNKTFFAIILILFVFFSIGSIGYTIYYHTQEKPLTSSTGYFNVLNYANPEDGETYTFEVNMFSNKKNNGKKCFDFAINYYTDSEVPETSGEYKNIYSSGIQIVDNLNTTYHDDYSFMNLGSAYKYWTINNAYYYNRTYNDVSYSAVNSLKDMSHWIVDCGGKLVCLDIKGNVKTGEQWTGYWIYTKFDFNYMLIDLYNAVSSLKTGEQIIQFDLSKYFTFREYNEETNQYDKPVTADLNFVIVDIKVNKSDNGLIDARQSLFNSLKYDPEYSLTKPLDDYYSYSSTYYLNEYDFEKVIKSNNTCFLILKDNIVNYISCFIDLNIVCEINIDSNYFVNSYCLGFSADALKGININYCSVQSKSPTTFYLNNNAINMVVDSNITIEGGGL